MIYTSQWIRDAIAKGHILDSVPESQIQPTSLDLRISQKGWRVLCSFLPGEEGIEAKLKRLSWESLHRSLEQPSGVILERNAVYLFEIEEDLALPALVRGRANPKSSTGRLDVFTRVITENGTSFDEIPYGYHGRLFLEVVPRSFALRVRAGDALAQIRFENADSQVGDAQLAYAIDADTMVFDEDLEFISSKDLKIQDGLFLSVMLEGQSVVGYRARKNTPPIDFRTRGTLAISDFWEPIESSNTRPVILEPDEFYIFMSRERISIPPTLCAEMVPFDASSGEIRTHYAGFFDPGFGYSDSDIDLTKPSHIVLEVRGHDVPYLLEHARPCFRVKFYENKIVPDKLYGSSIQSNYQGQGLRLGKQFRQTR